MPSATGSASWRRAIAIGSIGVLASCGRVSYSASDAPIGEGLDARSPDASADLDAFSFDAAVDRDAFSFDAPGLDASMPDVPMPDVSASDAGLDAHSPDAAGTCRVRWSSRLAGSTNDVSNPPWVGPGGDVFWGGFGGAGGGAVLAGSPCDGHCLASFSRDGSSRYVVPTEGYVGHGPDRAIASAVNMTGVTLREYDRPTGAAGATLGSIAVGATVTGGVAFGTTSAMTFYGTATGDVGLLGGATPLTGRGGYAAHWELTGGSSTSDWAVVFDGPDDEMIPFARLLPDGSVGVWARTGATSACVSGVARPDTTSPCAPAASSLLMIVSADGVVEDAFATAASLQARLEFLADHGTVVRTSSSLERWRADGTVVWDRPLTGAWTSVRMLHDAPRGRVVVVTSFDATTRYDGSLFRTLEAPETAGIVVLELDDDTGAQLRTFTFGVAGTAGAAGVTVDAMGRLYVAVEIDGMAAVCTEDRATTTAGRDAWLLAID